ncbi:MAG: monovalent cation/H+ antiporter complex subunit F [Rhodobacterales bacterium]|jgi:multicomponent Na+:H+ antiporter subunit F|nr:monovalent cation/H+ antiporter complex subunit F [Pseudomonadota bacterium]MDA1285546.1 monovalent cation/H+ antiporter complex subunit F [Pseudomonadota bacterium]NQW14855.1 pH regulation protein F [Rhodobacter sp.]HBN30363.1 pH regulation protein F [Paracoccaceae bacterium]
MFAIAAIAILVGMILVLIRLYLGPSVYDRVLAVNLFGTHTVLLIGVMGFLTGRPDFLDIALLYALINFVGTIAILKFFRYRAIGDMAHRPQRQKADP